MVASQEGTRINSRIHPSMARAALLDDVETEVSCATKGIAPAHQSDDPSSVLTFEEGADSLTLTVRHCSRQSAHTGGHVWSSARHLAKWLYARRTRLDGVRILELGCGLGLPSLVAARCGSRVEATDELPALVAHLKVNARRNECSPNIETRTLDFNRRSDVYATADRGPLFDLVVFSDIVYGASGGSALPYALAKLLLSSPAAAVVGAFPSQRDGGAVRNGISEFWEHASRLLTWREASGGTSAAGSQLSTPSTPAEDPRYGDLYVFGLQSGAAATLAASAWASEEEGAEASPLAPLFAEDDDGTSLAGGGATFDGPSTFAELPDDVLERIACALTDDLCEGVRSLCMLSRCDVRLRSLALRADVLGRCAAQHGLHGSATLPLLDVIETVTGLGTHRVYFASGRRALENSMEPTIRPGSSMPRLVEFALLMRRHPTLTLSIEGHAGTHECEPAADDRALRRAEAVRKALVDLECLERLDKRGNKVWGRIPKVRLGPRLTVRGWDDAVSSIAGWSGTLATCHAECFFRLGGSGHEVPARPEHYALAAASFNDDVGWRRYFEEQQ